MNITDMKGHAFEARRLVPEQQLSIANYARAVGSTDPRFYRSESARDAGYRSRPLPPSMLTFFNTLEESDLLDTLGVVYGKTLFAGTDFEFGVVATEEQVLIGQTKIDDAYERTGSDGTVRQFMVLVTEFRTDQDELVSRSRLTFIEKAG